MLMYKYAIMKMNDWHLQEMKYYYTKSKVFQKHLQILWRWNKEFEIEVFQEQLQMDIICKLAKKPKNFGRGKKALKTLRFVTKIIN